MARRNHSGMRNTVKPVAKKAKGMRGAGLKRSDFLAEIEKIRLKEDDIVAKYLAEAPKYIVAPSGERVKVDKTILANTIREKIEHAIQLRMLIHDLNCTDPNDMVLAPLRDSVRFLKNTEEGRASLVEIVKARLDKGKREDVRRKGQQVRVKSVKCKAATTPRRRRKRI